MSNFFTGELICAMDSVTIRILMALQFFISSPDVSWAPEHTSHSLLSPSAGVSHRPATPQTQTEPHLCFQLLPPRHSTLA